jgi:hypothetical protein
MNIAMHFSVDVDTVSAVDIEPFVERSMDSLKELIEQAGNFLVKVDGGTAEEIAKRVERDGEDIALVYVYGLDPSGNEINVFDLWLEEGKPDAEFVDPLRDIFGDIEELQEVTEGDLRVTRTISFDRLQGRLGCGYLSTV